MYMYIYIYTWVKVCVHEIIIEEHLQIGVDTFGHYKQPRTPIHLHLVASAHTYSSMRTHTAVRAHTFTSISAHIQQYILPHTSLHLVVSAHTYSEHTNIPTSAHTCSSMRTHTKQYEDTYIPASAHTYSSMRTHVQQYADT